MTAPRPATAAPSAVAIRSRRPAVSGASSPVKRWWASAARIRVNMSPEVAISVSAPSPVTTPARRRRPVAGEPSPGTMWRSADCQV
nr:hypothetical protein [Microbispora cellulosiformans]